MNNNNAAIETIELSLPVNAAYVSAARLTASSIANRLGFDVDEIEDIKAAVSEACIYIIKKMTVTSGMFNITFSIFEGHIAVRLKCEASQMAKEFEDELSIHMIKALMDIMEINVRDKAEFTIEMSKSHKVRSFE